MSQELDEPSQPVRSRSKRPAKVALSESGSDEEGTPNGTPNGKVKRARPSTSRSINLDSSQLEQSDSDADRRRKKGKGRAEANGTNGHLESDEEDDEDVEEDEPEEGAPVRIGYRPEYDRGSDGFVAGSIVRIKMRNFMTYDSVEFRPGPHLNMILGPNGTGKSTIAACIAIGLGFKPKVMGRDTHVSGYVKLGTEEAETEIELKGKKDRKNVIIYRKLQKESGHSEWMINGKASAAKAVRDLVKDMGAQADNLCSFLPQDKVAEFAKMDQVFTLKETMRAAGDPRLLKWHTALVENGTRLRRIEGVLERDTERRDALQHQVNRMEPDVQNIRARADKEFEREVLRVVEIAAERKEVTAAFSNATKERSKLATAVKELEKRRRPLMDLHQHMTEKRDKGEARLKASYDSLEDFSKRVQKSKRQHTAIHDDGEENRREMRALNTSLKRREDDRRRYQQTIRSAQTILDEPRGDVRDQITAKQDERKRYMRQLQEVQEEGRSKRDEHDSLMREVDRLTKDIEHLSKKQRDLADAEKQRENAARDLDGSINYALDWIEKNAMKLEGRVHKPAMISVNVTDPQFSWQVESCTSLGQRKTFVCESRRDYETLLRLNGTRFPRRRSLARGHELPEGEVRLFLQHLEPTDAAVNPPRPCDVNTLRQLGFSGFAVDFIECAPAIRAFLISAAKLHQAALSRNHGSRIDVQATTAAGIRSWVTSSDVNRAIQSSYGRRDFQITTLPPQQARAFVHSVNQDQVKQTEDELARCKTAKMEKEQPLQNLKTEISKLGKKRETLDASIRSCNEDLVDLKNEVGKYHKAETDKKRAEERLRALEAEPSAEDQRKSLRREMLKIAKRFLGPIQAVTEAADEVLSAGMKGGSAMFLAMQSSVNLEAIQAQVDGGDKNVADLHEAIERLDAEKDELRAKASSLVDRIKEAFVQVGEINPAVGVEARERVKDPPPLADVRRLIQEIDDELELTVGIDPNIRLRYEKASRELAEIKASVADQEKETTGLKTAINKVLADFDPALNKLVEVVSEKFTTAFERVGCSGEVRINRVEGDFSLWGLMIMVSYRDGDMLQQLTGTLQSGGERSLATVTYLMSLSEMARTPFSLVDEINQGMDQRAERNVHNQLVDVTCATDAGQYFLITPKLLTGLKYHRNMKVLIINNGTYIPDSNDKRQKFGDLKSCLNRYKSIQAAA